LKPLLLLLLLWLLLRLRLCDGHLWVLPADERPQALQAAGSACRTQRTGSMSSLHVMSCWYQIDCCL
jgi:hypothetical protein